MSRLSRASGLVPLALPSLCLLACTDRSVVEVTPAQESVEHDEFFVTLNNELDILFVVDDSGSMEREQDQIVANFHRMIEKLENLPTGLPSIHIGVVSTDVGSGELGAAPHPPGVLRNQPRIPGCAPPDGQFIEDVVLADGTRRRNYTGTLADTFACIAKLGIEGSGFEQPLEAMRLALDPATGANAGFLRDNALLAVVFLTDEDDCSVHDDGLFALALQPLGPYGFRCFAQGIVCDEETPPTQLGVRTHCESNEGSAYLTPVADYVADLVDTKPFASRIVVAGIMGKPGPIEVWIDPGDRPETSDDEIAVKRTCEIGTTDPHGAYAPTRTDQFLAGFGQRVRTSICDEDLSGAMDEVGNHIRMLITPSCIDGDLLDANPAINGLQAECSVTEIRGDARTIIPLCDATASNQPCYAIEADSERCNFTAHHLEIALHYPADANRDPDTRIDAQCRVE